MEAEEALRAIRLGEVDAVVVDGTSGPQVYTLRDADRPYRIIVERMQEGALTLTPDGMILYANQRLAAFLGVAVGNIVGQKFGQFIAPDDREMFGMLLAEGDAGNGRSELVLRAADGTAVPVYLSMVDLPGEDQRIIAGIVTDLRWQKQRIQELAETNAKMAAAIADRDRVEAMLRQAQKMEAVGQLTAGIAHDFNNLLSVIGGSLDLLRARARDVSMKRRIEAGQRAVERGARMTEQLLAFSRIQSLRPRSTAVNALLRDLEPLLRSSVGDAISLTLVLSNTAAECLVDPTELQASILNLIANAKDAMPDGGSLTITTAEAALDTPRDDEAGSMPHDGYLSIVVTDTGHGMQPETRERAFDPFFTTKDVGQGTGLGLSQVYGFMHQTGGRVTIESSTGAGTSVRLSLPRTVAPAVTQASQASTPDIVLDRQQLSQARRVLVVEDNRDVRELVVELLEDMGYATFTAENGPEALHLLDSGTVVDVVLSDVLMPGGLSGFQLAREIRGRLPHLPIVLTSGMTRLPGVEEDALQDQMILRKPYRFEDLAQAIEATLATAAAQSSV